MSSQPKEIVNIKALFVWTIGYVDIITYPLAKYYYIIVRRYLIYVLFILLISKLSFLLLLYTASRRYKKDYLLPPCQYRYFVLYYVLYH